MKDHDLIQFTNGIEYLDKLTFLTRCRIQCTLLEMGYDHSQTGGGAILTRKKIDNGFEKVYSAAENELQKGLFLPLEYLFWLFDCDLFERHAVLMILLNQIYPEISSFFTMIHNDKRMDYPTPFAVLRTYEPQGEFVDYAAYFATRSKLLKYFLATEEVHIDSKLTLDKRILEFVLGVTINKSYYSPTATLWSREGESEDERFGVDLEVASRLGTYIQNCQDFNEHILFNFFGEKGAGRSSCTKYIARMNGLNLMFIDLLFLINDKEPLTLIENIMRECQIFQAIPVIVNYTEDMPVGHQAVIYYLFDTIIKNFEYSFAITEHRLLLDHLKKEILLISKELGKLSLETSVRVWEMESKNYLVDQKVSLQELAGEFTLTPGQIKAAFRAASAVANLDGDGTITLKELKRGCYSTLQFSMGSKAAKLEPIYTWNDLVLPQYQKNLLLTACNQVRYKYMVYHEWGFQDKMSYGKNVSMLFTGPPGTGKTMAAQVVSNELELDVYKIELATIVSKYIGETEKNLNEIFQQAEKSQVILFFDEADVLFSKRTEVKDSNDKYSNMEAAFLLQKMEEYDGITILATNYIQNFDEAFKRRIKFVIDFPFPDPEQRRQIWQKVFPTQMPLGELDFDFLTSRFELSGSNIKNIALHSAFLAAADGSEKVEMKHIMAAIRNEFAKSGKIFTKEDAGEYYVLLQ